MPLYDFVNGTEEQKERYRLGPSLMQNLPVESLALAVRVEFIPYSEMSSGGTSLAETRVEEGDASSETDVRIDYPLFGGGDGKLESLEAEAARWGLAYDGLLHANETPVHELGHSAFAALPAGARLRIVEMFGGSSTDPSVIYDNDLAWEDRIGEGIAETFKEAFLPAQYRTFPNRTNQRIAYENFPEFRRIFRRLIGEGTNTYCYLYGSTVNRRPDVEAKGIELPVHFSERDPEAFVEYTELEDFPAGWGVQMEQFEESGKLPFTIEPGGDVIG